MIYQRAFEEFPSPETLTAADVVFGFSPLNGVRDRRSGSRISCHVATGYFGDFRFPLLKQAAGQIRDRLKQNGAEFIIAYFDENSLDDVRWHTGHDFMARNYEYLLERVLQNPRLGVVFKPKAPATLRRRLGNVSPMLMEAEATGRCRIIEGGTNQGVHPPALAALAADVSIHGHLHAGTAGMEAALAGSPTLLLDREECTRSRLHALAEGGIVFQEWDPLLAACMDLWKYPERAALLRAAWEPLLNELDPFRDGRAAERIGTYMKWVLDAFRSGADRNEAMSRASERYAGVWGEDKISLP